MQNGAEVGLGPLPFSNRYHPFPSSQRIWGPYPPVLFPTYLSRIRSRVGLARLSCHPHPQHFPHQLPNWSLSLGPQVLFGGVVTAFIS